MKKTLLFLFGLFFTIMTASADGGWADCAVNLTKDGGASYLYSFGNETWADGEWILNDSFDGYNFGTPSSLVLNGGVGNAWTNDTPGYNPSSFVLYYRVYKTGTMPGTWSQIALDNVNPQNGQNSVFDKTTAGIDVLALATDAGTYILEVAMSKNQFYAGGNWNSMIPGGQTTAYNSSSGGYKATFTKSASIATLAVTGISPSSGTSAGGTSVVITGTNFTGVTAVKFGSVNATNFTVNSNTQITATSPAGAAGTVDVTVTTAEGTSATSASDKFTILAAAPSIAYGVNLVVNGDAETGNLTGWTAGGTDAAYFVNDVTTPYGDSAEAGHNRVFDFYGSTLKNQEATLSQTIDITALQSQISSGLVSATSSGQIYGWYSDGSASITITELDANNNALLTHTNGLLHLGQHDNYPNTFWTKDIPMMGTLNSNTRKLKITLYAHTSPTIIEDFVDFDNIQLILSTVPTVTTSTVTIFDATSATMGGDVAANGGATVTERGFVYSLASNNTNPQIGGAGVTKVAYSSGGTGSFSQSVGSLAAGTLYYVNAYATNSVGTSYGTVTSFTTMVVANPVISVSGVTAGGLSAAITAAGGDLATVTSLTVTGNIDARDFKTMRDAMPNLAVLDLSGATIVAGANIDGTAGITNYPANEIPANAFSDGTMGKSSLTSFSMPSTITSIGGMAFNGCSNLTGSLTIPASVNSIGSMAFGGCSMISSIKAYGATPCSGLNLNVFAGMSTSTCILHVPFGTKALYEAADQWKAFMPNIVEDLVIAPAATTTAASSVTSSGAILNATVNAYGASTTVTFEYGLTTSYGNTVTADQIIGTSATAVSYALTGLTPNTNYHYRVVGVNAEGTTHGGDMTFSTTDIAPNISYVTPQIYTVGTPIAALTPTNTGGAVVAISSPQVSTLAGSDVSGSADGLGTAASFNIPVFLAPDAAGNLYVSDLVNNMIRKITPAGSVSTLADVSAGFNEPAGIAVDPSGNVYVAENENHRIRKITPAGVVSTVAGSDSGERGNTNGSGTAARFNAPAGLTLDAAGNLYVSDNGNKQIRKITPAGEVSTFAGSGIFGSTDGNGTSASFKSPIGIVIDASGNLYVADSRSNLIRKISPTGDVSTFAGSGAEGSTNGNGTLASFNAPEGIAIDASGNLYIADSENNLIRKINHAGDVTTLAGNGSLGTDNGAAETASFGQPYGVALDASGNLYVADTYNNLIRKITQSAYTITPALPAGLSFDGATGTISGTPTAASAATTYTVTTANNGGSSTTTISIAVKNPQTISFGTLASKTYGDAMFDLAATSTSGLAVSYSSDNTAVATVSGNTVTIVGAGTANITATQAGDATHFAAANVTQQLSVGKKALTVMAVADTKTYDGTTASTAVPTVGPQASGDAINVAPAQTFDNATVGTAHVLTASGLTLKNGATDVTGNYDISYVSASGVINKRALTITDPTVVTSKAVDGNTAAVVSSSCTLQNVLGSDLNNVAVTAAANYDNATAGINKTITVVYTLSGSASGNYTAPVNFIITDAKIVDISSGVDAPTVSDAEAVTAYPTQVAMGQSCQVRVSGLTDSELQGTALSVYNTQGICVYHSTKVGLTNSIALPPVQGMYLGRAITAKGKEFQFKVIVTR